MISLFQYSRIVAAFLVLLIHQHFLPSIPFLDSLKGCAVPLFACIAGYLYRGGAKSGGFFSLTAYGPLSILWLTMSC